MAILAENVKPLLKGIERADSIACDLHKWMHMPFEAGCVLVRNSEVHRRTFTLTPDYLAHETRGLAAGYWFSDYGLQLSLQFRALKVWMSIKEHGLDRFGRMIARNVEQAHYFGRLVEQDPNLELMAPIGGMDIVCFRFNSGGLDDEKLNALNKDILICLHESGIDRLGGAFPPLRRDHPGERLDSPRHRVHRQRQPDHAGGERQHFVRRAADPRRHLGR